MNYSELKRKQHDELDSFPMFFAFSEKLFEEGMQKLGVTDIKTLFRIPGDGFIRKSDYEKFSSLLDRLDSEMKEALQDREFLIDAIEYELCNHEYGYTYDHEPAIRALGISLDNDMSRECFDVVRKRVLQSAVIS